jgi:hypothetical protein
MLNRNSIQHSSFTIQHSFPPLGIHMIIIPPIPSRRRNKAGSTAAPAALTLVAATYSTGAWVRLTFDRHVNIAGLLVAAITVNDDDSDEFWIGSGTATLFAPQTVQVPLVILHSSSGPGTELTATNATGIVAGDDGGTWAGVANLSLPFP